MGVATTNPNSSLESMKLLIGFVFKSKDQLTGALADGKINFFEGIAIAAMATEAAALVKEKIPNIKLKKLTAAETKEIVDSIIADFKLTKNKPLEAQIKKSIAWVEATKELIEGWKTIKQG